MYEIINIFIYVIWDLVGNNNNIIAYLFILTY